MNWRRVPRFVCNLRVIAREFVVSPRSLLHNLGDGQYRPSHLNENQHIDWHSEKLLHRAFQNLQLSLLFKQQSFNVILISVCKLFGFVKDLSCFGLVLLFVLITKLQADCNDIKGWRAGGKYPIIKAVLPRLLDRPYSSSDSTTALALLFDTLPPPGTASACCLAFLLRMVAILGIQIGVKDTTTSFALSSDNKGWHRKARQRKQVACNTMAEDLETAQLNKVSHVVQNLRRVPAFSLYLSRIYRSSMRNIRQATISTAL